MSILHTIKNDALAARKARNMNEASILITLSSEAAMVGKNAGNRDSSDDEVITVIKKFLKNNAETLRVVTDPETRTRFEQERAILLRYVPTELSEEEIRNELISFGEITKKDMGRIMKHLNSKYPGRINGQLVSGLIG